MSKLYGANISDAAWALIELHRQCQAGGNVVAQSSTCLAQGVSTGCCRARFHPEVPSYHSYRV